MGVLILEDGAGKVLTRHTVSCCHCQKVIAIVEGPLEGCFEFFREGRMCRRCNKALCQACAVQMRTTGLCNPFEAKLEEALKTGTWDENFQFHYKIRPD